MEGLEFVFIELPKFRAKKYTDKKIQVLWLRFLSKINDSQEGISLDFLEVPEIKEATELILESGMTKSDLETYDRYWDIIRNLKKSGVSNSDISTATRFSVQKIENFT